MEINNAVWLSPMEGVSDLGFRAICAKRGADLTFTEMIRADALLRQNQATLELIDPHIPGIPTGLQLLVSKPEVLRDTLLLIAEKIKEKDPRFCNLSCIDLNFGCPSKEVIARGGGPALLKRASRMQELLSTLKKYSPLPCGIKIRLGLGRADRINRVYLRIIEMANELKLDWITVHPKTADKKSIDQLDYDALSEIIEISEVPIIGNGFVTNFKSAKRLFDIGCKGVMIAREAITNPWVFEEIKKSLEANWPINVPKNYATVLKEYEQTVAQFPTKDKFLKFHRKSMQAHIEGDLRYHSPNKILEWV